jgi:hypothetical protein
MSDLAAKAQSFAEDVVCTVTDAVESGTVISLHASLSKLQADFVAQVAGHPVEIGKLAKSDEQRMVWGWASVSTVDGVLYTDVQGDQVTTAEIQKAAHAFMQECRVGKVMHAGRKKGYVADSIVFTKALQDALGIDLGMEGWFVGYKVEDDETWERVKKGELRAFSIGGLGNRTPITP